MLRGIYTSCTGMTAEMDQLNVISNNLANVNTVGFKRDNSTTVPFGELLLNAYSKRLPQQVGTLGLGVQAATQYVDFSAGSLTETDNQTDLAIKGEGLFAVQTPDGVRYTRAGNFQVDKDNYLVTSSGYRVLGQNGPIQLNQDSDQTTAVFTVTNDGDVIQNDNVINSLQIFSTKGMVKQGDALYSNPTAQPSTNCQIEQGFLEQSNVNPVREMVQMINVQRTYEANQKALSTHDEALNKLVNDLPSSTS